METAKDKYTLAREVKQYSDEQIEHLIQEINSKDPAKIKEIKTLSLSVAHDKEECHLLGIYQTSKSNPKDYLLSIAFAYAILNNKGS